MASKVRQRPNGKQDDGSIGESISPSSSSSSSPRSKPPQRIGLLDIARMIAGLILVSSLISYFVTGTIFWGPRPVWTRPAWVKSRIRGEIRLTPEQLSHYDGTDASKPIYIGLDGLIYDVSASPHFYGPGGSYNVFAGKDASRAFVTGCFAEDQTDDLRGIEEMFIPVNLDAPVPLPDTATDAERKKVRGEWKVKREQARREGKKKVRQAIERWKASFEGGPGKYGGGSTKYFRVGKVAKEDGWESKLGPVPELCERAKNLRPKLKT